MKHLFNAQRNRVVLMLMISLLLFLMAACSSSTTASEGSSSEESNNSSSGNSDQEMNIVFSIFSNENDLFSQLFKDWVAQVEEGTDGRIIFEPYYGGSLVSLFDTLDAVSNGTVDAGLLAASAISGQIPSLGLFEVYGVYGDHEQFQALYKEVTPHLEKILREHGMELLFWAPGATKILMWSNDDFIVTPEDYNGLTIRAAGRWFAEQQELLGAVPIVMDPAELYLALQNGTVDATDQTANLSRTFKLYEVASKFSLSDLPSNAVMYVVNSAVWEKVPEEDQTIIKQISEQVGLQSYKAMEEGELAIVDEILEHGVEMYQLTDEERQALQEHYDQVFDVILAEAGDEGEPIHEIIQKHR